MKRVMSILAFPLSFLFTTATSTQEADQKANELIESYTNSNNEHLSWRCFIDDAIVFAHEQSGSQELLLALHEARDATGIVGVVRKFKPFGDEVKAKLPETFEKIRNTYSLWQLKRIADSLIGRNGKAACEDMRIECYEKKMKS